MKGCWVMKTNLLARTLKEMWAALQLEPWMQQPMANHPDHSMELVPVFWKEQMEARLATRATANLTNQRGRPRRTPTKYKSQDPKFVMTNKEKAYRCGPNPGGF